jgi:hypothetical protein
MKNIGEKLRVKLLIYQGVYPHLVGGIPTPLKKLISWDYSSQLNGK